MLYVLSNHYNCHATCWRFWSITPKLTHRSPSELGFGRLPTKEASEVTPNASERLRKLHCEEDNRTPLALFLNSTETLRA
jgi:hypothetical protein